MLWSIQGGHIWTNVDQSVQTNDDSGGQQELSFIHTGIDYPNYRINITTTATKIVTSKTIINITTTLLQ